jgi:hypothetical protein
MRMVTNECYPGAQLMTIVPLTPPCLSPIVSTRLLGLLVPWASQFHAVFSGFIQDS